MKVVVLGGGVIGASITHELIKGGATATLLEARYFTYGSTGRATGSVTTQQRRKELVSLAKETIKMISEIKKEGIEEGIPFAWNLMDDSSPHIAIARNEAEAQRIESLREEWIAGGADVKEGDESYLKEVLPIIETSAVYKAYVTLEDMKVMPHPLTWARIALARKGGAQTYSGVGKARVVVTDSGVNVKFGNASIRADVAVIAQGGESLETVKDLGDSLRTEVFVKAAAGFVTEPFRYAYKPTIRVFSESYRFLQTVRSEFVATIDDLGYPAKEMNNEDSLRFLVRASKITAELMPRMKYVNILRSWGAYADFTADEYPIIGWSKKYGDRIYYAFGFGDFGLSVSQAVAKAVAEEIIKGINNPILRKFRP